MLGTFAAIRIPWWAFLLAGIVSTFIAPWRWSVKLGCALLWGVAWLAYTNGAEVIAGLIAAPLLLFGVLSLSLSLIHI